jgi:Lar family restriction alleviation protein
MKKVIEAKVIIGVCPEPKDAGNHPDDVCWRCGGKKNVEVGDGTFTPCGACLGSGKNPEVCPECGSRKIKLRSDDGLASVCYYCRDCGLMGPVNLREQDALNAWNEQTVRWAVKNPRSL